jgi:hypothetical protein
MFIPLWGWWVFDFCTTHQFQGLRKKSECERELPVPGIWKTFKMKEPTKT